MNLGLKIATFTCFFLYKFHWDFNQPADWLGNPPERHGGDWIVESPPKICQMPTVRCTSGGRILGRSLFLWSVSPLSMA